MLALRFRCRCRCSHMLPCYRTRLPLLKQVPSRRPTHFHLMSSEVSTRSFAWRPESEQMTIRNEGMCIAPWLISMLLASVLPLDMPDTKMRPRRGRFYRPPTAAPLSLKPDGHFQQKHFHPVPGVRDLPFESAFKPTQLCGGSHHITTRRLRLWRRRFR